jgi:hypothetical protein
VIAETAGACTGSDWVRGALAFDDAGTLASWAERYFKGWFWWLKKPFTHNTNKILSPYVGLGLVSPGVFTKFRNGPLSFHQVWK